MPYITNDGKSLPINSSFTIGETDYPPSWLRRASEQAKTELGIQWVEPPESEFKDGRYWNNSVGADGSVSVTPRSVESIREVIIRDAKKNANSALKESDWQVIAKLERGREVPQDWADYRSAVLAECARIEEEATAADFDSIQELEPNWPESPDQKAQRLRDEAARELITEE